MSAGELDRLWRRAKKLRDSWIFALLIGRRDAARAAAQKWAELLPEISRLRRFPPPE